MSQAIVTLNPFVALNGIVTLFWAPKRGVALPRVVHPSPQLHSSTRGENRFVALECWIAQLQRPLIVPWR